MFAIHRPHIGSKVIALALAAGAAAIAGIVQASAAGEDLPAFTCTNKSGGVPNAQATVSALRVAHHNGYDRLVVEFAGSSIPEYQLTRQASSTFVEDASGMPRTLEGSAGIRAVMHGTDISSGVPSDLKPRLPEIREVRQVGNFERVVSYGIGLKDQACFRAFTLNAPTRLVIDVETPADPAAVNPAGNAAATNPPAAATIEPTSTAAGATPSNLAVTGHPAAAGQPASMPIVPIVGLLIVTAGLAILGLRRFVQR
jgi:hypothetical protein